MRQRTFANIQPFQPRRRRRAFQRGTELGNIFTPMNPLCELLGSQRDKNAEDNDTDLAEKDSPTMAWFG